MKWKIVADSSSDPIFGDLSREDIKVSYVPFTINTDNNEYVDYPDLDVNEMLLDIESSKNLCKTACPASGLWLEEFKEADNIIAIAISGNLSGSFQSALSAKEIAKDEYPDKKVIVLDSCSAGSELSLGVKKTIELIDEGLNIEEIEARMISFFLNTHVIFALSSFDNFIKSGRINPAVGFLAKALKIWGIGVGSDDGVIIVKDKVRSEKKVVSVILEAIEESGFNNTGRVAISQCLNEKLAEDLKEAIHNKWSDAKVYIGPTTGLCSFYAERSGIIVSYTNE